MHSEVPLTPSPHRTAPRLAWRYFVGNKRPARHCPGAIFPQTPPPPMRMCQHLSECTDEIVSVEGRSTCYPMIRYGQHRRRIKRRYISDACASKHIRNDNSGFGCRERLAMMIMSLLTKVNMFMKYKENGASKPLQ